MQQTKLNIPEIQKEAILKLIAFKKKTGLYNVLIKHAGLEWSMALTTYDNKPFDKKRVYVAAHFEMSQKCVATLTPQEAGYTKEEFESYH